jgi:ribosomal protein S18 acetylase RimI-like enzyme
MNIRPFAPTDESAVIALWHACGLTRPWNDPAKDIARKLTVQPELFLVGEQGGAVVATIMAAFDGHRGSINYLAVQPALQRNGLGQRMMAAAQTRLLALGCPKINLHIRASNAQAAGFYAALGYTQDDVISVGKRLIPDD